MFTIVFLKATLERAIKTAAQSLVAAIGVTATLGGIDWKTAGSTAGLAAVLSVATSVASGVKTGTPSLVRETAAPPRPHPTLDSGGHITLTSSQDETTGLDRLARADRRQVTDGPPRRE